MKQIKENPDDASYEKSTFLIMYCVPLQTKLSVKA